MSYIQEKKGKLYQKISLQLEFPNINRIIKLSINPRLNFQHLRPILSEKFDSDITHMPFKVYFLNNKKQTLDLNTPFYQIDAFQQPKQAQCSMKVDEAIIKIVLIFIIRLMDLKLGFIIKMYIHNKQGHFKDTRRDHELQINKIQYQSHKFKSLLGQLRSHKKDIGRIVKGVNRSRLVSEERHNNRSAYDEGIQHKPNRTMNNRVDVKKAIGIVHNNNHSHNVSNIGRIKENSRIQDGKFSFMYNCYDSSFADLKKLQNKDLLQQKQQNKIQVGRQENNSNSINGCSIRKHVNKERIKCMNPQQSAIEISGKSLLKYLLSLQSYVCHESQTHQIYDFFSSLSAYFGISNKEYVIKRYSNCLYYGEKTQDIYQGFLWTDSQVMYYGTFSHHRKHQHGLQVHLNSKEIWKGQYKYGKKQGFFQVLTPSFTYLGNVSNGFFQGEGSLTAQASTYKGNFRTGLKSGYGQEIFHHENITYKGQYLDNKFEGKGQITKQNYYYNGYFKDNKPDGEGYERTDEFEYNGQFVKGRKQGRGILKLKNSPGYEGVFKDGRLVDTRLMQQEPMKLRIKIKKKERENGKGQMSNVMIQNRSQQYLKVFSDDQPQKQRYRQQQQQQQKGNEYGYRRNQFMLVDNSDDEELPLQTKII